MTITERMKKYAELSRAAHEEGEIGGDAFTESGLAFDGMFSDLQAAMKALEVAREFSDGCMQFNSPKAMSACEEFKKTIADILGAKP